MTLVDIPSGDFVTTTLNGAISAAATTMTIGTGLNIPAANGILQIDYDSSTAVGADNGPETIYYTSYTTGTGAISGMTRGYDANTSGVAHANGASVQAGPSVAHLTYPKNIYSFRAYDSGGTTLTDGVATKIALATESYDYNSNFATGTYTAPLAGVYHFDGCVLSSALATPVNAYTAIYKNGAVAFYGTQTVPATLGTLNHVSGDILLAASDTIELYHFQNTAGNETSGTGETDSWLSGHLIHAV